MLNYPLPTEEEIISRTEEVFGYKPCHFQVDVARKQLIAYQKPIESRKGVVFTSGTGSGKTLCFLIPSLFVNTGITIIIAPLNVLSEQFQQRLESVGIQAANVTGKHIPDELFKVGLHIYSQIPVNDTVFQDIKENKYQFIITNPEVIRHDHRFLKLWSIESFTSRLFSIVFDEAHCISEWGDSFRVDYAALGEIHFRAPSHTLFYLTSATLSPQALDVTLRKLHLSRRTIDLVQRSNDRTNVSLEVHEMKHPQNSYLDLKFLVNGAHHTATESGEANNTPSPPLKFMVFCNTRNEAYGAAKYLRSQLSQQNKNKVVWFHSGMSDEFKRSRIDMFIEGKIWGLCCTDAAGLVCAIRL